MRAPRLAGVSSIVSLVVAVACGGSATSTTGASGGQGGASATSSSSGAGGHAPMCDAMHACTKPGEACVDGSCVADCRHASATPCANGAVCDTSDAHPGACVAPGTACLTTSAPEKCGALVCGPGSACDGKGACYPLVPCGQVACDATSCWGTSCACSRAPAACAPAPLGMPGQMGTLNDPAFLAGLVDLDFAPDCSAWGVTLISGPDYLRSIASDGTVQSIAGVTNLNMGEVSVLQHQTVPASGAHRPPVAPADLEVGLTYICCATCGCQLATTPQGAARLDPATSTIPLVIPSKTFTDGKGPFGGDVIDTGPEGLSYGTDRVLYVGNVDANGDYVALDLTTKKQTLVTKFASRVHASTSFDDRSMLVALEGGEIRLLRLTDATSKTWAMSDAPVTGMVRDFFDGTVYVARGDSGIWKYDANGKGALWQTATNPSRVAIAPDGYLYAISIPAPFYDHTPSLARWQLPAMR